jgi:hypothetical protein
MNNAGFKNCAEITQLRAQKNPISKTDWVIINMAATYSPSVMRVPSAMGDLTSLFGMGRGEHPRQNHHKIFLSTYAKALADK